ncbi:hypothetical protein NHX12_009101 [Muraenolepis orangiensis]|uniref:Uncharacterized protein n=1 Tax=Muraenolepis orangiensis TaxID=630683 RepID=A0A9Q0DKW4_9TELE|nr:hypothetical protein NHX12_009101 [Muraenolepis orangiensis]
MAGVQPRPPPEIQMSPDMSHVLPATLFTHCRLTLSGVVSYPLIVPISGKCVGSPYEAHIPTGLRIQTLNLQPPFGHVATIFR